MLSAKPVLRHKGLCAMCNRLRCYGGDTKEKYGVLDS